MARIGFYPLDITYKIVNNRAVIFIFGKTTDNRQICVVDDSFEPYFYVELKDGADMGVLSDRIKSLTAEKHNITAFVRSVKTAKKRFLGKEITLLKVFANLPAAVPELKEKIKDMAGVKDVFEYDIPFARRYLVDKNITPLLLTEAEGDYTNQKSRVSVLKASEIKQKGEDVLENPKIVALDIETYNPAGKTMLPEKNPVIMIGLYSDDFKKVLSWKKFKTALDYVEFCESEADMLQKFKETVEKIKPDIITGYFSDGFDMPYLHKRAEISKVKLDIGLDYSELKVKSTRNGTICSINGIMHIDVFKFIRKVISSSLETDSYDLSSVAQELLGEGKTDVELDELAPAWDSGTKKLEKFCEYNLNDARITFKLTEKMMPNISELVKIVGLTAFDINRMGFSQLVEWYLIKQAQNFNELIPNKPNYEETKKRRAVTYKGAFVFEPKPGLYKDIVVFDYRSLYPTIISSHNIGPGTLNCSCCKDAKKAPVENKNYWFCTKKKGFVPTVIEDLITRRMRIKEMIKKKPTVWLDARQESLKILANSFYGYLGFFGARWYSLECAQSVTAYGRYYIHKVIDEAKEKGFDVIYSDTDSVFLVLGKNKKEDVDKFVEKVNMELPGLMELEYEGFYPRGIFVSAKVGEYGAKKKYALLGEDKSVKIKGFETVRRNWSLIAKETQEKVLEIILKENDIEKAVGYVKQVVKNLREKKVDMEKVVIVTQLQKEIGSYDQIGPHVAAARRMISKGIGAEAGTMVKYIIVQGKEKIRDRARLVDEVKNEEYDADYYINNQVIPAVERIFSVLGYEKDDLAGAIGQSKLEKFF